MGWAGTAPLIVVLLETLQQARQHFCCRLFMVRVGVAYANDEMS